MTNMSYIIYKVSKNFGFLNCLVIFDKLVVYEEKQTYILNNIISHSPTVEYDYSLNRRSLR